MKLTTLHPPAERESVVVEIVRLIAAVEGCEPDEIDPPLYDAVDPIALDDLFAGDRSRAVGGRVTFEYRGYDVTVTADRRVAVEFPVDRSTPRDAPSETVSPRE